MLARSSCCQAASVSAALLQRLQLLLMLQFEVPLVPLVPLPPPLLVVVLVSLEMWKYNWCSMLVHTDWSMLVLPLLVLHVVAVCTCRIASMDSRSADWC